VDADSGDRSSGGESSSARRRRKRRAAADAAPAAPPPAARIDAAPKKHRKARANADAAEHSLRDLVGAGKSRVGVSGALRARDLNRPTAEDLAAAEREVVIVRRHWQPPAN